MSYRCPVCGAVSHNPNDEREGYCARCHDFTETVQYGSRPLYWVLDDGHNAVPAATLMQYAEMFKDVGGRTVDYTEFHVAGQAEPVCVSTVFLGIDHGFGFSERPVLFETMVFGGLFDQEQWRYCTWDEAAAGHKAVVAQLMARYVVAAAGED